MKDHLTTHNNHVIQSETLTFDFSRASPQYQQELQQFYMNHQFHQGLEGLEYVFIDELQYVTEDINTSQRIQFYEKSRFKYIRKNRFDQLSEIAIMNPHSFQKLNKIVHINFPNLLQLSLQGICVSTIQRLAFLNAPLLTKLQLQQNRITSLKPLAKIIFKGLQILSLQNNRFHQVKNLNRASIQRLKELTFNKQTQEEFMWTQTQQNDHEIIVQDLRPLLKNQYEFNVNIFKFDNENRTVNHQLLHSMIKFNIKFQL